MSFLHDIIKIMYVQDGYLADYPPHLISDEEMMDAFLPVAYPVTDDVWNAFLEDDVNSFFKDMYPCLGDELVDQYRTLVESIAYHVNAFKQSTEDNRKVPDWVYAYMNGATIGPNSEDLDVADLLALLRIKDIDIAFDSEVGEGCYRVSEAWLKKVHALNEHRPPTIFGEPHVIKALRVSELLEV